jgi:hypothetical protein
VRNEVGEKPDGPRLGDFVENAGAGSGSISYGPTATHKESLSRAESLLAGLNSTLDAIVDRSIALEERLKAIGAPPLEAR